MLCDLNVLRGSKIEDSVTKIQVIYYMAVKVLMTWDIAGERDQEYFEFIIGEFIPGVQRLGLQPAEAWATIYGSYPQIQVGLPATLPSPQGPDPND
jgi:hypothetical protein